nr:uncharacterized protein LOC109193377 [Ipomoea batatas]
MEVQEPLLKVQQSPKGRKIWQIPLENVYVTGTKATGSQLLIAKDHSSLCKPGFQRRLWEKWFGNKINDVNEEKSNGCDKFLVRKLVKKLHKVSKVLKHKEWLTGYYSILTVYQAADGIESPKTMPFSWTSP